MGNSGSSSGYSNNEQSGVSIDSKDAIIQSSGSSRRSFENEKQIKSANERFMMQIPNSAGLRKSESQFLPREIGLNQ